MQEVVKRIVVELQARGYRTWFGARDGSSPARCLCPLSWCGWRGSPHRPHSSDSCASACASDLDNMKGSTVDAMSAAIDNAEVMLSCVSLAYKESASKQRQQQVLSAYAFKHVADYQCARLTL